MGSGNSVEQSITKPSPKHVLMRLKVHGLYLGRKNTTFHPFNESNGKPNVVWPTEGLMTPNKGLLAKESRSAGA